MVKAKNIDGKKFMWDGNSYENVDTAQNAQKNYSEEGFETRIVQDEGKYEVYTRRIVTEVVVDGGAPL